MVEVSHPLNPAAVISLTACFIGLLFGGTTLVIARARRMRGARLFALSCLIGGLYASTNAAIALGSPSISWFALRFSIMFTALHGAAWYGFTAAREGRALHRWEKLVIAGAIAWGLVGPIPRLVYTDEIWHHHIAWANVRYLDWHSTWVGDAAFAYFALAIGALFVRSLRRFPRADSIERAETFGLGVLLLTGINDALASADLIQMPYLLDVGFLALIAIVAGSFANQFADKAQALEAAQAELVRRERLAALGEMSAVVAHEVRNPVAIIFNAVSQLRKGPEKNEELLSIVQDEAERLKRMATDLLEFARPANVAFVRANLRALIEDAVAATLGGHQQDHAEIQLDVAEGTSPVECDPRLVRQAIVNLTTNALQACTRTGTVHISARADGDMICVAVADDGEGVERESLDKIFTPFFTTRPTGTGLGLSVVRRIAAAHHGDLSYRPTEGGGATFELCIPKRQPSP
jgi:signal transduction histidine kinase